MPLTRKKLFREWMQRIAGAVGRIGLTDLPGSYPGRAVNVNGEEKHENMNAVLNAAALQSTLRTAGMFMTCAISGVDF